MFFVDAKKAFDNLNWDFLFLTMDKLDLGMEFNNEIRGIYSNQNAFIRMNSDNQCIECTKRH